MRGAGMRPAPRMKISHRAVRVFVRQNGCRSSHRNLMALMCVEISGKKRFVEIRSIATLHFFFLGLEIFFFEAVLPSRVPEELADLLLSCAGTWREAARRGCRPESISWSFLLLDSKSSFESEISLSLSLWPMGSPCLLGSVSSF